MGLISFLLDLRIFDSLKRFESLLPKSLFPKKLLIFKVLQTSESEAYSKCLVYLQEFPVDLQTVTNDCLTQVARKQTSNHQEHTLQAT